MAHDPNPRLTRRRLLLSAGTVAPLAGVAGAAVIQGDMPWRDGESQRPAGAAAAPAAPSYQFFSPADDLGPGALEAGRAASVPQAR